METPGNSSLKFISVSEKIRSQILAGTFKVGDKIPSERKLAEQLSVNFATVNKALAHLAAQGYLACEHGRGTFVKDWQKNEKASGRILFINGESIEPDFTTNYLNWFVRSEIQKGIINSSKGIVRFNSFEEILEKADENSAVILIASTEELIEKFEKRGLPYVAIGQFRKNCIDHNTISSDHLAGAYEGVAYLAEELGHRDIGIITAGPSHYSRFAGYQIALRTFEIPFREELVVKSAGGTSEDGYNAMFKLLDSGKSVTAVFADTDMKALGAVDAIRNRGLRVPEDISVLGFDDRPESALWHPPLTTIKAPYYEMGQEAVKMIDEMTGQGIMNIPSRILKPRLLIRESCRKIS